MNAATWPRAGGRLLVSAGDRVTPAAALADSLGPGDLLVLNDAQERLYIFGLEQGRSLDLLQTQSLPEIFESARRSP